MQPSAIPGTAPCPHATSKMARFASQKTVITGRGGNLFVCFVSKCTNVLKPSYIFQGRQTVSLHSIFLMFLKEHSLKHLSTEGASGLYEIHYDVH